MQLRYELGNLKCSLAVKQEDQPNCPATLMCGGLLRARSVVKTLRVQVGPNRKTLLKKEIRRIKGAKKQIHLNTWLKPSKRKEARTQSLKWVEGGEQNDSAEVGGVSSA